MANNYVQASFVVECYGPDKELLLELVDQSKESDEPIEGLCYPESNGVWFGFEESIDIDGVAEVIAQWQKLIPDPGLPVVIEFCYSCSKPRVGEFGGGVIVVHKGNITAENTQDIASRLVKDALA